MRRKTKKKKSRKRGTTLAGFQRAVASNKGLRAAKKALAKAEARKKRAYKKALAAAKRKMRSRARR